MVASNKHSVGLDGERLAAEFLTRKGYAILARNYRVRQGEIDLIVRRGETVAFVEVRARSRDDGIDPVETVDLAKQRQVALIAEHYTAEHDLAGMDLRFDVIGIVGRPGKRVDITHIENAFSAER